MKSSITTRSTFGSDPSPGSLRPVMIRTNAMRGSGKTMPKKDNVAVPGEDGMAQANPKAKTSVRLGTRVATSTWAKVRWRRTFKIARNLTERTQRSPEP